MKPCSFILGHWFSLELHFYPRTKTIHIKFKWGLLDGSGIDSIERVVEHQQIALMDVNEALFIHTWSLVPIRAPFLPSDQDDTH